MRRDPSPSYERRPDGVWPPLAAFLASLFPFPCLGCHRPLPWPAPPLGLCPGCQARVAPQPVAACRRCGRPSAAGRRPVAGCGACRRRPPPFDRFLAAYVYRPPLDAVVRGLKFARLEFLADGLGRALAVAVARAEPSRGMLVVPVPLSWRRRSTRGFNQAALLGRTVAREVGLPYEGALRRRHRAPQVRAGRADRWRRQAGAFAARRPLAGAAVLLVDDVATTGATAWAASAALRAAGADPVWVAVVARTPEAGAGGSQRLAVDDPSFRLSAPGRGRR